VSATDYNRTLEQLRRRYGELRDQRRKITAEMIRLIKIIQELAALCGEPAEVLPPEQQLETDASRLLAESWLRYMPFVDAIRTALRIVYPNAFTTSELRELLKRSGYAIESKSDPIVALNVALNRFVDAGEVEITTKDEWRKGYRWAFKNELTPPPSAPWEPKIDWKALVHDADETSNKRASDPRNSKLRRSRGASRSLDSRWLEGYGEVPGRNK